MSRGNVAFNAFNRGLASPKALARVDIEKLRLSAERQENFVPRVIGSMCLRPGWEYIRSTLSNKRALLIPFVYSNSDTAIIEFTDGAFRPLLDCCSITRPAVSTSVTSGDFSAGTGWTIADYHGGNAQITGGELVFSNIPIGSYSTCKQTLTIASEDQNKEHGLRIHVARGPVIFKVGSTDGGEEYIPQTELGTGYHSLAFTPTGANAYLHFESHEILQIKVNSIEIEAAGDIILQSPYLETDLPYVRYTQSGDVFFLDCRGIRPMRIERRSARSWSIVSYELLDGPFMATANQRDLKFSISAERGVATLTASQAIFKNSFVGVLYRIFTAGYNFEIKLAKEDAFTPAVRVNGVGAARAVSVTRAGTWSGTLTLQLSYVGEDSGFLDVTTYTSNGSATYTNDSDNTAVWVRLGFKTGAYTSGTAEVTLTFGAGGGGRDGGSMNSTGSATSPGGRYGIVRILSVASPTSASVEIISPFSSNVASEFWQEGEWSDRRGWPSAVDFYEGRLFHAGADKVIGSVPDAYSSFSPDVIGDSGVIQRSIGYGPVQYINWILPISRLIIGGDSSEISIRSSSFDEPLTPTNFSLKDVSTNGSAAIDSVKIDQRGVFVDKSLTRLIELFYSVESNDYTSNDLTQIIPDENVSNPILRIVAQRRPDTRIHCIREDGTVLCLLYEPRENTLCWYTVTTKGHVEDAVVLPGTYEDVVYYVVRRTINAETVRYYERWAREDECVGGTLNKQADSFVVYQGSPTTVITGLSHLAGEAVVAWADGSYMGEFTVTAGQITLPEEVSNAVIGLRYHAYYKSAKLAYGAQSGTALNQRKRVNKLGILLYKSHHLGVEHGPDFDSLSSLPQVELGMDIPEGMIHETLDVDMTEHGGGWDTDSRVCLKASAPLPVTIVGMTVQVGTHENV